MKKIMIFLVILSSITSLAFAQPDPTATGGPNDPPGTNNQSQDTEPIKLVNPLAGDDGQGIETLPQFVEGILRIVLTIGVPLIALAIIYAGFKFISAQGNPEKLKEARRTLLYVIIGAGILLAAYVIAEAIVGTINAIRN